MTSTPLNKQLTEALIITMEECAEVQQEASKCIRFGEAENIQRLQKEIGDLMCMLEWLSDNGIIDWAAVSQQVGIKRDKLKVYSNIYGVEK